MATLGERQKGTFVGADYCLNFYSIEYKDSMDKLKFTTLKKVWPEDVQDFGRFAKHQDPMTYALESSREVSSEGFTDLKQDLLL